MASFGKAVANSGTWMAELGNALVSLPKRAYQQARGTGSFAPQATLSILEKPANWRQATVQMGGKAGSAVLNIPGWVAKKSGRLGLWIVEQPFAWLVQGVNLVGGTVTGLFQKAPLPMAIVTAVAAVFGIGHVVTEGKRREGNAQAMMQMAALQGMQNGMPPMGQQSFMNVTSPQDYAAMQARNKVQGENAPGFADAARASAVAPASQEPTPGAL